MIEKENKTAKLAKAYSADSKDRINKSSSVCKKSIKCSINVIKRRSELKS